MSGVGSSRTDAVAVAWNFPAGTWWGAPGTEPPSKAHEALPISDHKQSCAAELRQVLAESAETPFALPPAAAEELRRILKRPARGSACASTAASSDRAFEFSRKQMEEADDIIGNLLEEVASLRSLSAAAEKPSSGQQDQIEEACQRSSRVEEVARERQRQMQVELNAHCKIPGPRVKFAQYVDEKMAASSRMGSNNCRRQPPL